MSDIEQYRMRDAWGYLPSHAWYMTGTPAPAPDLGHTKHLCYMVESSVDIDSYKRLVKDAKFICRDCGRAAAKAENLCSPVKL